MALSILIVLSVLSIIGLAVAVVTTVRAEADLAGGDPVEFTYRAYSA